jgi:hypothetical protein
VGEEIAGLAPDVLFDSIGEAEAAVRSQNFHAHMVPGRFPLPASVPADGEAYALGPVRVFSRTANSVRVRGSFQVPSVSPGHYTVVFCDRGCDRWLGDLAPAPLRIVKNHTDLSVGQRIDRAVESLKEDLQSATKSDAAQMTAVERLDGRVQELERLAERIARTDRRTNRWLPLVWFALGGAAAAVAVTAFERRREPTRAPRDAVKRLTLHD